MSETVYTIDDIKRIVAPVAKRHGVERVYLFGSYARGAATPYSDIDLCVDAAALRGLFALAGLRADLEEALNKELDLITVNSLKYNKDLQFLENLRKDQVLIYEMASERPKNAGTDPSRRWTGAPSKECAISSPTITVQWTWSAHGTRRRPTCRS